MNNIYLDNIVSCTCSLKSVYVGAYVGALNCFAEMRVQIYSYSLIWSTRLACVSFPAANINPILPILKARLGFASVMALRWITELYFLALHCLLFVSYMLVFPHKLAVSSAGLRHVAYCKICSTRTYKVKHVRGPSTRVENWARLDGACVKRGRTYTLGKISFQQILTL